MIARSLRKFLERLDAGDPVAYGLLGFLVFLLAVAGLIWLVDLKKQRREKAGGRRGNRSAGPGPPW